MPSEDISAQQAQNFGGDLNAMWDAYHYRPTQSDADTLTKWAAQMNPGVGETAPKYFDLVDPQLQLAQMNANPYTTPGWGRSTVDPAGMPDTVYGNRSGRFVDTSGPGGKGGQWVGGFAQLGGSKSQGPNFEHLGSNVKYDPSQAVWDDNYGWIIPKPQQKGNPDDWVTQALMTGASMAFGGLPGLTGVGLLGPMLVNAASSYGNGASLGKTAIGLLPGLIGAGMGGNLGIMPELGSALKYGQGAYNAYNQFKQGNNLGGGLTLGKLAGNFFPSGG